MADLAALLDKEASAEIEGILSEARARASEIVESAKSEGEALVAGRRRSLEASQRAALVRARSSAQLDASSLTLRAQHAVIEKVFDEVEERIELFSSQPEYPKVLEVLLQEAVLASGAAPEEIRAVAVNPKDQKAAKSAAQGLALADKVEPDPTVKGGVRLDAGGRHVSIENTLYGRLASLRDELAAEVAQVLLSKEG